ncbi:popC protein [Nymphaea thermarum]|nr:popC protein [Nymphaea thermarum]
MHDLIRDMGRKIIQDSRSRLWKDDETLDVLQTKKGTENIEAIQLNSGTYREPTRVEAKSFVVMSELRMLRLGEYVRLKGEFEHFPKKLRWLQWNIRHFSSLPNGLHLETIVVLDLSNSWITQLWNPQGLESTKVFGKMKVLKLDGCWMLTSCPDFKRMPHLEKLNLNGCRRMSELDPSIGLLESLTHLTLSNCASLKELNPEKWQLTSLEKLDLNGCDEITTLPSQLGNSKSLACLSLCNCKSLMELPDVSSLKGLRQIYGTAKGLSMFSDLDKLEELDLSGCEDLMRCPLFSSNMTHLWRLDFEDCAKMTELDPSIVHLKSLTVLILRNCESLKELPKEVSQLTSLKRLDLTGCYQISALPESMSHLKQLEWLSLGECSSLTEIPECICSFLNLEELDVSWTAIEEMPHSIVSLENLSSLSVSHCYRLKLLPWLPRSLDILMAKGCRKLEDVPGIKQMKLLQVLDLGGCRSLHDSFLERLEAYIVTVQMRRTWRLGGRRAENI